MLTYWTHIRSSRTSSWYCFRLLSALVAASSACVSSFLLAWVLYCSCVHLMYLQQEHASMGQEEMAHAAVLQLRVRSACSHCAGSVDVCAGDGIVHCMHDCSCTQQSLIMQRKLLILLCISNPVGTAVMRTPTACKGRPCAVRVLTSAMPAVGHQLLLVCPPGRPCKETEGAAGQAASLLLAVAVWGNSLDSC